MPQTSGMRQASRLVLCSHEKKPMKVSLKDLVIKVNVSFLQIFQDDFRATAHLLSRDTRRPHS